MHRISKTSQNYNRFLTYTNKKNKVMKKEENIIFPKNAEMTFREVDGIWRRVDSQEPKPPTLAECLDSLFITIDDYTQFCRIIRYYTNIKQTIIYRAYGGKIRISILYNKI